jgi:serine/threonine protein kinase/tetratricopeptide (TPR) repeat protein
VSDVRQSQDLARFEVFELDLRTGELRGGDQVFRFSDQPLRILVALLERPGELVLREDLRKRLWPNDTVVEFEHSISAAINKVRQALGDSAESPRFIETLARRGYRWKTSVEWIASRPDAPPSAAPAAGGLVGKRVSHYRVLRIIGGGMGLVYEAEDLNLGRRVALKVLPEELLTDRAALERFRREARAASASDHPNICTIYEVGEHEGAPFLAMQLLQGQSLSERIEAGARTPMPFPELLAVAIQVADGLAAAHKEGIIHRDIKPANIFLTTRGEAKILDFGLAKLAAEEHMDTHVREPVREPRHPSLEISRARAAMGTAAYMSPEQLRGEKLDARTDLFSFGLVLYEMATGMRAFSGNTPEELHEAILTKIPAPVGELNSEVPLAFQAVVNRTLAKDRSARYQTAAEVQSDLQRLREPDRPAVAAAPARSQTSPLKWPQRRTWQTLAGSALLLVIVTLATRYYMHRREASRLTEQDTIVLANFANSTGDPVFDDTLKQATSVALGQSPFLNILPDRAVRSTLKLMTRPPNTALSPDIAREVCQRAGSKAYVAGAIAALGSEYVVGLKAVNCLSGEILADEKVTASRKDQVLDALGDAISHLRSALGESLVTVRTFDVRLPQATTSSLEALKEYTLGNRAGREKGPNAALPYYLRAVQLDPNFAMIYLNMGSAYTMLGQNERASEYFTRAYQLRDHATEHESLIISGIYQFGVNGDLERAIEAYEKTVQNYPNELPTYTELATAYARLGQYDKAIDAGKRGQPDDVVYYAALGQWYVSVQRFADAKNVVQQAQLRKLESGPLRLLLYAMAFLEADAQEMQKQMSWLQALPGDKDQVLSIQADTESVAGHLSKAGALINQAVEFALKTNDDKEGAALLLGNSALREAEVGDLVHARQDSVRALKVAPKSRGIEAEAALALAMAGCRVGEVCAAGPERAVPVRHPSAVPLVANRRRSIGTRAAQAGGCHRSPSESHPVRAGLSAQRTGKFLPAHGLRPRPSLSRARGRSCRGCRIPKDPRP